jgi:hypothetical protein
LQRFISTGYNPAALSGPGQAAPTARQQADALESQHLNALRQLQDAQRREAAAKNSLFAGRDVELRAARQARLEAQRAVKDIEGQLDQARVAAAAEQAKAPTGGSPQPMSLEEVNRGLARTAAATYLPEEVRREILGPPAAPGGPPASPEAEKAPPPIRQTGASPAQSQGPSQPSAETPAQRRERLMAKMRAKQPVQAPGTGISPELASAPEPLTRAERAAEERSNAVRLEDIPDELRARVENVVQAMKGFHDPDALRETARVAFAGGGEEGLSELLSMQEERLKPAPEPTPDNIARARAEWQGAMAELTRAIREGYEHFRRGGLIREAYTRRLAAHIRQTDEGTAAARSPSAHGPTSTAPGSVGATEPGPVGGAEPAGAAAAGAAEPVGGRGGAGDELADLDLAGRNAVKQEAKQRYQFALGEYNRQVGLLREVRSRLKKLGVPDANLVGYTKASLDADAIKKLDVLAQSFAENEPEKWGADPITAADLIHQALSGPKPEPPDEARVLRDVAEAYRASRGEAYIPEGPLPGAAVSEVAPGVNFSRPPGAAAPGQPARAGQPYTPMGTGLGWLHGPVAKAQDLLPVAKGILRHLGSVFQRKTDVAARELNKGLAWFDNAIRQANGDRPTLERSSWRSPTTSRRGRSRRPTCRPISRRRRRRSAPRTTPWSPSCAAWGCSTPSSTTTSATCGKTRATPTPRPRRSGRGWRGERASPAPRATARSAPSRPTRTASPPGSRRRLGTPSSCTC